MSVTDHLKHTSQRKLVRMNMGIKMKAMVLRARGQPPQLEDVEIPTPGPDEVLVQVMACSCDITDWKIIDGVAYVPKLPIILGHETAGVVARVGANVTEWKPGDRVAVYNYSYCGSCFFCRGHREQLCRNMTGVLGIMERSGGHAEYTCVLARQLVSVPASVAWPDAATCCDAGVTGIHAVDRGGVKPGETVVVIGIGGVGAVVTQRCKAVGARVVVVVLDELRGQRALDMGADQVLCARDLDIAEAVRNLTDGLGADCVMDVVGVEETMSYGMNSLRPGGRMVLVGYTEERYPLKGEQLDQNELTIVGTRGGRLQDLRNTVGLVADGAIKSVVTDLYPLEEANEVYGFVRAGKALGRVMLLTPAGRKAMGKE
jgi:2-desacetyl-2-hydroxyethyl bacteriochlorophyllide A dehydrogenase